MENLESKFEQFTCSTTAPAPQPLAESGSKLLELLQSPPVSGKKPNPLHQPQFQDLQMSVQVNLTKTGPNSPIKVSWSCTQRLLDLFPSKTRGNYALELGIYRHSQHFHDNPIISRRLDYQAKTKKCYLRLVGYMNFKTPRSPGQYEFRVVLKHPQEDQFVYALIAKTTTFVVNIQGDDLDEALQFIGQRLEKTETMASAMLQFSRLIEQVTQLTDEKVETSRKRVGYLHFLIHKCCTMVVPINRNELPETYDREVHYALASLIESIDQNGHVCSYLDVQLKQMILVYQKQMYCPLAELFFLPNTRERQEFWKKHYEFEPWQWTPSQIPFRSIQVLATQCMIPYVQRLIPSPQEFIEPRQQVLQKLRQLVIPLHVEVQVFGSSENNFGTIQSDMDMCLINLEEQHGSTVEQLTKLNELIQQTAGFEHIESRLTARIPIVMFKDLDTNLDCDISINNPLAIRNTALLRAYSLCDPRIRPLAYIIKKWTKYRRMNNPSEGTLSSYGYLLMLLSFLQKCQPPVLPVLQSIPPDWKGYTFEEPPRGLPSTSIPSQPCHSINDPERIYETYFYDPEVDRTRLEYLNAFGARNQCNLGQLFLHFLHYYAIEFQPTHQVITIRQGLPMTTESKLQDCPNWKKSRRYSIEDPFETDYDVAHVLKDSRYHYIRQQFARAYALLEKGCREATDPKDIEQAFEQVYTQVDTVPFLREPKDTEEKPTTT